jgi:hypothetical protein
MYARRGGLVDERTFRAQKPSPALRRTVEIGTLYLLSSHSDADGKAHAKTSLAGDVMPRFVPHVQVDARKPIVFFATM